jgi:hypothetical protein
MQLTPIYLDVASGTQEFMPAPEESRSIIRQGGCSCSCSWRGILWVHHPFSPCWLDWATLVITYHGGVAYKVRGSGHHSPHKLLPPAGYAVPRNLLLRFAADTIDETPQLASTLQSSGEGRRLRHASTVSVT